MSVLKRRSNCLRRDKKQRYLRRLRVEPLEVRRLLDTHGLVEESTDHKTIEQVFYLDFDGASGITFDGRITVEDIEVPLFAAAARSTVTSAK